MSATAYRISYHPEVKAADLTKIDRRGRERIRKAIEERLLTSPEVYGRKLQRTLKDYWKLRVGPYRIVFKLTERHIRVLGIIHRKDVYQARERRLK